MKKSFLVSTGFFGGLFLMATMAILPTYSLYSMVHAPFEQFIQGAGHAYTQLGIPAINYKNGCASSNGDQLFLKTFKDEENKESKGFTIGIDTSATPDATLTQKIRTGMGGVVVYRDSLVFYDTGKMQERTILFKQLGDKLSFTLDDSKVAELSGSLGRWVFRGIVALALVFFGAGKIFWWLVFAFFFSSKASRCGGGNYSLGLWILTPATLYQTFASSFALPALCGCGVYYLILLATAWGFGRFLVPLPPKEG